MDITPEEAQAALNDIQHAETAARNVVNIYAFHTLLWGVIWTSGFLASQFLPQQITWIWIVMLALGMTGSAYIGTIQGRRIRTTPGSRAAFVSTQIGIFYSVLYGFAILWLIIFPHTPPQVGMLWITVVMFGFIISGAWLRVPLLIGLGVGITLLSVVGYYLVPDHFWLWVAVFAGLPLLGMGTYLLRKK